MRSGLTLKILEKIKKKIHRREIYSVDSTNGYMVAPEACAEMERVTHIKLSHAMSNVVWKLETLWPCF